MGYERDSDKALGKELIVGMRYRNAGEDEVHPAYLDDIAGDDIDCAAGDLTEPLQEVINTYNLTASQVRYMVDKMFRNELIKPSLRNI